MIQSHYTIAKLPEGPFPDRTQYHAADIQSAIGSGKRKRSELAVAIDNSGISLYDVNNSYPNQNALKYLNRGPGTLNEAHNLIQYISANHLHMPAMLHSPSKRQLG